MDHITINGIEYRFFDHLYAVSKCGLVLRKFASYTPTRHNMGYLTLGRQRLMHRVVAACWLPDFDPDKHVHHINFDKSDNRAENLECVTPREHFTERHNPPSLGAIRSKETREKISLARIGKKDGEITRAKKAAILAEVCPKTPCKFQGVLYPSITAAARAAKMHVQSFRTRCKSRNFPEYEIIST